MTACNAKDVAHSDNPTENDHPTVKFLSALQSLLASFSSTVQYLPRTNHQTDEDGN